MPVLYRFLLNFSWNLVGRGFVFFSSFAISVLIARYLGKDRLGIYASILVIPAFIRLLSGFGLETVVNKLLPELQVHDPSLAQGRYVFRQLLMMRIGSSLFFCTLIYLLLPFYFEWVRTPDLLVYLWAIIFYFLAIAINSMFSSLLMTYLQYKITSIVESVNTLLNLVLLLAFILLDWGIHGVLYAYIISLALTTLAYARLSQRYMSGEIQKTGWNDMPHLAWVSYATGVIGFFLLTQSDIILMNYFHLEPERIGYYHLATNIAGMLTFIMVGIGPLSMSIFQETYTRNSDAGLKRSWFQIAGFLIFVSLPIYIFTLFNAKALVTLIYGKQFIQVSHVLVFYLSFLTPVMIMGGGLILTALYVINKKEVALRSTMESSVLKIGSNLILIPLFGEMGAVAGTGTAMVYMSFRQLHSLQKTIDVRPVFPFAGKCFLLSVGAAIPSEVSGWMGLNHIVIKAAIFSIAFLLLLAWRKPLTGEQQGFITQIHPLLGRWAKGFVR